MADSDWVDAPEGGDDWVDAPETDWVDAPPRGEIRNPRMQGTPNLLPTFLPSLSEPQPLGPIVPAFALVGDVFHDVASAGKAMLAPSVGAQAGMPFGSRFAENLKDTRTIGQTLSEQRATEMAEAGTPNPLLAGIQGTGLDLASIFAGGGYGAIEGGAEAFAPAVSRLGQGIQGLVRRPDMQKVSQGIASRFMPPPTQPVAQPFTPWEGINRVVPAKFSPWEGIGQAAPEVAQAVEAPIQPTNVAQAVEPQAPGYRPPVVGAGGQMELNLGGSLEGAPSNAFPFPEQVPPASRVPRTSPKWARQEAKRTFQREPDGAQQELDFGNDLFPRVQNAGRLPVSAYDTADDMLPGASAAAPGQGEFDFTKQASWAKEPAKKVPGLKISEEELARREAEGFVPPMPKRPTYKPFEEVELTDKQRRAIENEDFGVEPRAKADIENQNATERQALDISEDPNYWENVPEVAPLMDKLGLKYQNAMREGNVELAKKIAAEIDSVLDPETGNVLPSAMQDLGTILRGIKLRMRGLGSMGGNMRAELTPEARAALDRWYEIHAPKIAEHLQTKGASFASYVKQHHPDISPDELRAVTRYLSAQRPMVGNLRTDMMSPELKRVAEENPEISTRPTVPDEAVRMRAGTEGAAKAGESIVGMDIEDVAASTKHFNQMAEHMMALSKGNPKLADQYRAQAVDYLRQLSKIRKTFGVALRNAGQTGREADFLDELETALKRGDFTGADAADVREAIARGRRLRPTLRKMIDRGIQEYGINMMLLNSDTSMRNVIGGALGTILNPIERAGNALVTAGSRAVGIPEHRIAKPTEFEEVIPSLVAGVKAVPRALRSGAKFFMHESEKGVAENYAMQAKKLKKTLPREQAKTAIAELQKKKRQYREDFATQEDLSSLGIRNTRNLTSKNPVLDTVGKVINFGGQSLKAMDLTNSQIIKEMETTAAIIRKQVQAARRGDAGAKTVLTPADKRAIYDNVLHYTMRQKLPPALSSVYKGLNTNFVTGLLFPFMRAQITLPRFAMNRTPLALGSIGLNAARTIQGKEALDTMQITRAAMGTTAAVTGWLWLKKNGVEVHSAANTPEERALRKAAKIPQGVYLKFKDGTVKKVDDIAPVSYIFGLYAAFDDANRRAGEGQAKMDNYRQAAMEAMQNIMQGSVFTGIRDMGYAMEQTAKEAADGGRSEFPGRAEGERLDRGAGATWRDRKLVSLTVPSIAREAQRKGWGQEANPEFRSPRDIGEEYKTALGFGLEKSVPEQLNIFGETAKRGENMDPLREIFGKGTQTSQDPAIQLFETLGWYPSMPAKTMDGLRVTQDKRMAMLKQVGPEMHAEIQALAQDPGFQSLSKAEQLQEVKQIVADYMSEGNEDTRWKMEDQIDAMKKPQRDALRYNLKGKDVGVLEKWGLDY